MPGQEVYHRAAIDGFQHGSKVESLASSLRYKRVFIGTSEGHLLSYACNAVNGGNNEDGSKQTQFQMVFEDTLKASKARKNSLSQMKVVENWKVLVGIVDDVIMVYDINNFQCISQLLDTKGCQMFSLHEPSSMLCVTNKRKITLYSWQGSGFIPKREIALSETPKFILCVPGAVISGTKKHYDIIDLTTFTTFRLLEAEKEHQMVGLEVPANSIIGKTSRILLSVGLQGVLMDSSSAINSSTFKEKITWATAPIACAVTFPNKLITLQKGSLEIHDLGSLESIQFISFAAPSITQEPAMDIYRVGKTEEHIFLSTGAKVEVFVMASIKKQISELVRSYNYEEAISLYRQSVDVVDLGNVNIGEIHEKYAYLLYSKGDYESAAANFISADVPPLRFFMLFPDLVPISMTKSFGNIIENAGLERVDVENGQHNKNMSDPAVKRAAAAAMANFCLHHRAGVQAEADRSEGRHDTQGQMRFQNHEEDAVVLAKLLDSMLISALVGSGSPQKDAVIRLLKEPNRCDLEGGALLLSSHGNTMFEALLWLYRSHGEHKRALNSLNEERCVASAVWTMPQYYEWLAEYLRSLWYSDDGSLPALTLQYLKEVLHHDPKLGLSVLTVRPKGSSNFGGKNVTVQEVLQLLESVGKPKCTNVKEDILLAFEAIQDSSKDSRRGGSSNNNHNHNINKKGETNFGGIAIPLASGQALGISYLEWLVGSGAAPSSMHDEFVQLVVENITKSANDDADADGDICATDSEEILIMKVFRRKLRFFLQISDKYHIEKVMKLLPPSFLHERALIKAKAGLHDEALRIYVFQLRDYALASAYCDYLYESKPMTSSEPRTASSSITNNNNKYFVMKDLSHKGVYISLFKMILAGDGEDGGDGGRHQQQPLPSQKERIECVSRLAEVYYDRIDPVDFLELLDPATPLAIIMDYLDMITEHSNAKKRTLQVVHQIMRIKEVMSRTRS
jgi:tetratricopeptide (TPR) repeat protein